MGILIKQHIFLLERWKSFDHYGMDKTILKDKFLKKHLVAK